MRARLVLHGEQPNVQQHTADRGPVFRSTDDWQLFEPAVNRLIRDNFSSSSASEEAIAATVRVNTTAMSDRVREIIKLLGITGDHRIGDFGCGYGLMPLLLHAATGARVEAFDRSESFLSVGRSFAAAHPELAKGVSFARLDFVTESMPEGAGPYDTIILNNTLQYVVGTRNKLDVIRRLASVLKPGGALMVYGPNPWYPREPFTRLPMIHWLPRRMGNALSLRLGRRQLFDIQYNTPLGLRRLVRRAGLERVSYHPYGQERVRVADGFLHAILAPVLCRYFAMVGRSPSRGTVSIGVS